MSQAIDLKFLKKSVISFFAIFAILYGFSFFIDSSYTKLLSNIGQSYYDNNINNSTELQRNVKLKIVEHKPTFLEAHITFYDKRDESGNFIVKTIGTDLRREALLSVIFFIALIFSFPFGFKKNLLKFIIGFGILYLFIFIKLYIFIFDNYNYPEFIIKELPVVTSFVVYWGTYFFNVTGASTNVIAPVIIWFLLNIKSLKSMLRD